jgi:hypothetical protein
VLVRCVLAGGEVPGGEEQALHDLEDLLITMVGDVHKKQWGSMAGGEEWRRAHVPGEGPANMSGWDAHEHCGGVGVRLPYLIWLEVGQKGFVDGGAARVFHRRRWWHGVLLSRVLEGSEEAATKLLRVDVVLLVPLTGVKRLCIGESTARPSGGRALSSPALRETMFGRGRMKLVGMGSTSGSRRCSNSTGSGLGGSVGG